MITSGSGGHERPWATVLLTLILAAVAPAGVAAPVTWQSWTFDYDVSGDMDGLSLKNVSFQGRPLITKLSFPVMRVFYDSDACGPYADRLGGTLSPIPWANNATLAQREFTLNGQQWYEIGIRDQIGSYDIYQVYYLGADGTIDAHIYSKGLQCVVNHIHYPSWRIDFGLDGAAGDQILRDVGAGFVALTQEFDLSAVSAAAWRVRDATSGLTVEVLPGFPDFVIPDGSTNVPVEVYSNNTVFGRAYRTTEDTGWTFGPNTQVPFGNGEDITTGDTVLWYEAYLPHSSSDGSALWHSTGVRLVANLSGTAPPPPPPPPPPGQTQDFAGGAVTIGDYRPGAPYPSIVNVAGTDGVISKVTVRLTGLTHTYPDDVDVLLVGPGGQTVMLMSDAGGGDDVNGVSLTFDSSSFVTLPDDTQLSGGLFRPVNYEASDALPAPAPGGAYGTTLDVFNGLAANGAWRLYVVDDATTDVGTIGSWLLTITTTGTTPPTPDTTPDAFAFSDVTGANPGTLQVSNPVTIVGINTAAPISVLSGEYSLGCTATFTAVAGTISNGQTVCVRHTSAATYATSTNTTLTVGGVTDTFTSTTLAAPPPGTGQTQAFAGGAVALGDYQPGSPYPSLVNVAGMSGIISKVTVRLDGLTHTYPDDLDMLLVGPGGQTVMLMSDAGGGADLNGVSLTFDSGATATLPNASQISGGVFQPVNYEASDAFPAPAPGGAYGTSLNVFNGLAANGAWRLYVVDDATTDVGTIGSWTLTITTTSTTPPTPDTTPDAFAFTDVSGVALGVLQVSNAVTIAGINTAAPISVTGGDYSIGCGATFTNAAGTISNGQTVCVRHTSAATYATSTNTTLTVGGVADTFTSTTALAGTGQTQSFAGGAVAIGDYQPGAPYPSIVNVAGMSGIISKVTVRLDGLTHTYPDDLDMLLVGPGGQTVTLMSDAGGGADLNGMSLTFDSGAASTLPDNVQLSGGVYRPVNYGAGDPFPAPAPGGSYGTVLDVFNGLAANGAWRLYVVDDQATDAGTLGSWTLTITTQ